MKHTTILLLATASLATAQTDLMERTDQGLQKTGFIFGVPPCAAEENVPNTKEDVPTTNEMNRQIMREDAVANQPIALFSIPKENDPLLVEAIELLKWFVDQESSSHPRHTPTRVQQIQRKKKVEKAHDVIRRAESYLGTRL
jgi:hypothetical protein